MSVLTILHKNIKWRFSNAFTIAITILQPILWLVLYGAVGAKFMEGTGIDNYMSFILPGVILLVSFSTCGSSGIMNYSMKSGGSFYRILIAPISRYSIVLGQVLEAVICTFLEVFIMLLLGVFLGVSIESGIIGVILAIFILFMTAFFMASITYGISLILPNEIIYETVMNAIVLPVFFLSSALFPVNEISGILKLFININPFTHIIESLRSLILYGNIDISNILFVMIMLCVMCGVSFLWALHRLKKETSL